ncbi:hypothetical protein GQ457_08G014630 [Hibiscus cannabinus]
MAESETEKLLKAGSEDNMLDKMVVRKYEAKDVTVNDEEATVEDESMETNGETVMIEDLDASFKSLPRPLKDKSSCESDEPIQDLCGQPKPTVQKDVSNVDSNRVIFYVC